MLVTSAETDTRLVALSGTDAWYDARRQGISATAVARAATPAGFAAEVENMLNPVDIGDNDYMRFGRDWEQWIVDNIPAEYGLKHNNWLIHADGHKWQLATPDALNDDWSLIGEVKTTGKDWEYNGKRGYQHAIPIQYRRQVQWQMYVTGARACVFAWLLRIETADGFQPGWFEPKHMVIERDDAMIRELIDVAERLQMEMVHHDQWELEKGYADGTIQP
jgi:putative phage-type endonuclease